MESEIGFEEWIGLGHTPTGHTCTSKKEREYKQ